MGLLSLGFCLGDEKNFPTEQLLVHFCQFAIKSVMTNKHLFDSEGMAEAMGWKTYALCVGVSYFSLFRLQ
jgi:hypothetical protein